MFTYLCSRLLFYFFAILSDFRPDFWPDFDQIFGQGFDKVLGAGKNINTMYSTTGTEKYSFTVLLVRRKNLEKTFTYFSLLRVSLLFKTFLNQQLIGRPHIYIYTVSYTHLTLPTKRIV